MPRQNQRITEIINRMVAETVARIAPVMQRQIAAFAAAELEKNLAVSGAPRSRSKYRSRRADRRSRGGLLIGVLAGCPTSSSS